MKGTAYRTFALALGFFAFAPVASAHEAYVIDHATFWEMLRTPVSFRAFDALKNPSDLHLALIIVGSVLLLLLANFLFRKSAAGARFHSFLERYARWGPVIVRFTIAGAFFFSAQSMSFLGPELTLGSFPYQTVARMGLYAASIMIAFGIFTELAAAIGVAIFVTGFFVFGSYVLTYLNYLGELVVLLLFGMRIFSLDRHLFGPLRRFRFFEKYETTIVRSFYGLALMYAGLTVKFLHPDLTVKVVNDWHLTNFHWLFPSDPLLVTFGAGLAEIAIGFFILIGFETRLTVLISLFYITLSLLYFRELVWPHYLLYGISLNLLVQPEIFTVDHILFKHHRAEKKWWLRPFTSLNTRGKSDDGQAPKA